MSPFTPGSVVANKKLYDLVIEFGLDEYTVKAILLLPLVYVAWSDGTVQRAEAKQIRKIASDKGLIDREARDVVEKWLSESPDDSFFQAGFNLLLKFVQETGHQDEIHNILELSREVAKAAGGLFGLAFSVSQEEEEALEEIENVLLVNDSAGLYNLMHELDLEA